MGRIAKDDRYLIMGLRSQTNWKRVCFAR